MSTALKGAAPKEGMPLIDGLRVAIVRTEWNSEITGALADDANRALLAAGYPQDDVETFVVPGAIELTFAASQLIEASLFDVIIVIGCVIRGDTPHFDYVCQSVTQGITSLNADVDTPVIFGVLTVNNVEQAEERVRMGKGREFAETAVKMAAFADLVKNM